MANPAQNPAQDAQQQGSGGGAAQPRQSQPQQPVQSADQLHQIIGQRINSAQAQYNESAAGSVLRNLNAGGRSLESQWDATAPGAQVTSAQADAANGFRADMQQLMQQQGQALTDLLKQQQQELNDLPDFAMSASNIRQVGADLERKHRHDRDQLLKQQRDQMSQFMDQQKDLLTIANNGARFSDAEWNKQKQNAQNGLASLQQQVTGGEKGLNNIYTSMNSLADTQATAITRERLKAKYQKDISGLTVTTPGADPKGPPQQRITRNWSTMKCDIDHTTGEFKIGQVDAQSNLMKHLWSPKFVVGPWGEHAFAKEATEIYLSNFRGNFADYNFHVDASNKRVGMGIAEAYINAGIPLEDLQFKGQWKPDKDEWQRLKKMEMNYAQGQQRETASAQKGNIFKSTGGPVAGQVQQQATGQQGQAPAGQQPGQPPASDSPAAAAAAASHPSGRAAPAEMPAGRRAGQPAGGSASSSLSSSSSSTPPPLNGTTPGQGSGGAR